MRDAVSSKNKAYLLLRAVVTKDYKTLFSRQCLENLKNQVDWNISSENIPTLISEIEGVATNSVNRVTESRREKGRRLAHLLAETISSNADVLVLRALVTVCISEVQAAVDKVPKKEAMEEAKQVARDSLAIKGDRAISSLISNWDKFTYERCLVRENELAAELAISLKTALARDELLLDTEQQHYILVSALQEFERRAGQVRKTRAGHDLEQAVILIFEHLGLDFDPKPQLLLGDFETDLLILPNKNYKIAVSCKRTGRERVKQIGVNQTDLLRLRITKVLWFMTDFDQSENRVVDFGINGSIFYLPDESHVFQQLVANPATRPYVRGLSGIRSSIQEFFRP